MSLEYQPPSLESILNSTLAPRRLKGRDGYARAWDSEGNETDFALEGPIIDVNQAALAYEGEHQGHRIVVTENNCGHSGMPNTLSQGKKVTSL